MNSAIFASILRSARSNVSTASRWIRFPKRVFRSLQLLVQGFQFCLLGDFGVAMLDDDVAREHAAEFADVVDRLRPGFEGGFADIFAGVLLRVDVVEVSGTWLPETFRLPDETNQRETGNGVHA